MFNKCKRRVKDQLDDQGVDYYIIIGLTLKEETKIGPTNLKKKQWTQQCYRLSK